MDKRRKWISVMLEEALQVGVLDTEDVLRHTTPSVLATDLPPTLVSAVLQAGLDGEGFDSALVIKTLGAEAMAEHLPVPVLWSCLDEAAQTIIADHPLDQGHAAPAAAEPAEPTEEDSHEMVDPGDVVSEEVLADDMPEIEVLEE